MTTFISINPMTGEKLWKGKTASESEVHTAVAAARKAFPDWSSRSMEKRIDILHAFKKNLSTKQELLAEMISKEMGKPLWESLEETAAMIAKIEISIEAQQKRCPEITRTLTKGVSVITRHKPLGVLAVLGPFNFPGHLPNGHIVPALLAGNTVVFKPSELTPWVGETITKLWEESGLPPGVLNLIQGSVGTGRALSSHTGIDALLFTGSWNTGQALAKQFGSHPDKLLALEMGGNNPLVIGEISDFQATAYAIIQSAFITAGQRCTCARRLIIPSGKIGKAVLVALLQMIPNIKIGAFTDRPEPFMGPLVTQQAAEHLLETQKNLIEMGGIPLIEMQRTQPDTPLLSPGVIDVSAAKNLPDEECFGPLLRVIRVPDFATAINEANKTTYGLSGAILTDNREQYKTFYKNIRSGTVNWNTQTTGAASTAPFGGVGRSGNFRPGAYYAADYCNFPVASLESDKLTLPDNLKPGIHL